jgi:hypothetical protein
MKEQCSEIGSFYGEGMAITGRDPLTASTVVSFMLGWVRPLYPPTQKTAGFTSVLPVCAP